MIITNDILDEKVPKDMIPTRLDSALDLYTNIDRGNESGVLVYNTSPSTWNCLYPFYEMNHKFTVDNYDFRSEDITYRQLIAEYYDVYKNIYEGERGQTKDKRIKVLANEFKKTFSLDAVVIGEELPPVFELKFSKSKEVWTLYYFENYVASKVDSLSVLLSQSIYEQKILPLVPGIAEVDGIEVGSNVQYLLTLEDALKGLRRHLLKD